LLLGSLASGVIGLEHKIGGALATRLRRKSVWWHILAFWPVPALLGFHIFKGYWY
jgi:nitrite reductase (NADH) large subunit